MFCVYSQQLSSRLRASERVPSTQSQSNKLSVFTCFLSLLLLLSSAKTPRLSWKSTSSPSETS